MQINTPSTVRGVGHRMKATLLPTRLFIGVSNNISGIIFVFQRCLVPPRAVLFDLRSSQTAHALVVHSARRSRGFVFLFGMPLRLGHS